MIICVSDGPRVEGQPADLLGRERELHLSCLVESNPASQTVWYHNDLLLSTPGSHILLASNSTYQTLILEDVSRDNIGQYQCVATNSLGRDTGTVVVPGAPDTIRLHTATNTTDTSVQINWTITSLATIANTTIQYRAGYGEWNTITRLHHTQHQVGGKCGFSLIEGGQNEAKYPIYLSPKHQKRGQFKL